MAVEVDLNTSQWKVDGGGGFGRYGMSSWHESPFWFAEWKAGCCDDEVDPVVGIVVLRDDFPFWIPGEASRVRFRYIFERGVAEV